MTKWMAQIKISANDMDAVRRNYGDNLLKFDIREQNIFLESPRFSKCNSADDLRNVAGEIIANLNVAMRVIEDDFEGVTFLGATQERDGLLHRTMFAETAHFKIKSFVHAVGQALGPDGKIIPSPPPKRSFAERMTELLEKDTQVREAAFALSARPVSWSNLRIVYETVVGLLSPNQNRGDWKHLVAIQWISESDSNRFYDTASHNSHGHPKRSLKHPPAMPMKDGAKLITDLFRKLVDHFQPD